MNAKNPTGVIIAGTVFAGGFHLIVTFSQKGRGDHNVKIIVATLVLTAVLLFVAEVWPDGAKGLALIIALTAFVMNGGKVFKLLASLVD